MRLMLSLLFITKKRKRTLEESVLLIQQGENALRNELIDSYKPFIAKTVSGVCKRYIYETDDEFSIGLIAFNEAIDKYSSERGSSLLSFSEVLITRRVIDYIRKQARFQNIDLEFKSEQQDDDGSGSPIEDVISIEAYKNKSEQE
ncbi:MAG: sigma factor, partial [Bacillota bacterium]|nr:sigma factor [Bacillota bacterium]